MERRERGREVTRCALKLERECGGRESRKRVGGREGKRERDTEMWGGKERERGRRREREKKKEWREGERVWGGKEGERKRVIQTDRKEVKSGDEATPALPSRLLLHQEKSNLNLSFVIIMGGRLLIR